jgi:hypothetical protein
LSARAEKSSGAADNGEIAAGYRQWRARGRVSRSPLTISHDRSDRSAIGFQNLENLLSNRVVMGVCDCRPRPSHRSRTVGIQASRPRPSHDCTSSGLPVDGDDIAYTSDYEKVPWLDGGCNVGDGREFGRIGDVPLVLDEVVHIDLKDYGRRLREGGITTHNAEESCHWQKDSHGTTMRCGINEGKEKLV